MRTTLTKHDRQQREGTVRSHPCNSHTTPSLLPHSIHWQWGAFVSLQCYRYCARQRLCSGAGQRTGTGEQDPGALYALPRYQPSSFSASTLSASCKLRPPIKPRLSLVTFNLCSGSQPTHYGIQFSRILSWVGGKKNPPRSSQHMTQRPPTGSAVPLRPGAEDRQTPCWTGGFPRGEKRRQNTVSTTLS